MDQNPRVSVVAAAMLLLLFSAVSASGQAAGESGEVQDLEKRISVLETRKSGLEARLDDLRAQIESTGNTATASITAVETVVRKQLEILTLVLKILGGAAVVVLTVAGFFGFRTWQDMDKIHNARVEIEQANQKIREVAKYEELKALSRLYFESNQIDESLLVLDEVMQLTMTTGEMERQQVYFSRALCLKRQGRFAEAYNNAIEVTKALPKLAKGWYNAACYASLASSIDERYKRKSTDALRKAYELSPAYTASFALGQSHQAYDPGIQKAKPATPDADLNSVRDTEEFKAIFRSS